MKCNRFTFGVGILIANLLSACGTLGNLNSIHHEFNIADHQSQWVDADERGLYVGVNPKVNADVPGGAFICAEASPDAVASYNATIKAAATTPSNISGSISATDAETAASIGLRTVGVEALRDWNTSLCLREFDGQIERWRADLDFNRQQRYMIGLLAIDELANAAGSSASLSAGKTTKDNQSSGAAKDNADRTPADKNSNGGPSANGTATKTSARFGSGYADPSLISARYVATAADAAGQVVPMTLPKNTPAASTKPKGQSKSKISGTGAGEAPTSQSTQEDTGIAHVADVVADITKTMLSEDYTLSVCSTFFSDNIHDDKNFFDENKTNPVAQYCSTVIDDGKNYEALRSKLWTTYTNNCLDPAAYNKTFCSTLPPVFALAAVQQPGGSVNTSSAAKSSGVSDAKQKSLNDNFSPGPIQDYALQELMKAPIVTEKK